ncbi:Catenin-beta-like protein [Staphylotrichum tortipilum]|uniref:Catenin-beta-like protein n=1 Tax=Staphylotrichum tortipilum TaxID=2831512 RepID=A0AAN6RQL5_9PEZI|nr:Catenin-beta-like protein [Staphylotrichum longicolle]
MTSIDELFKKSGLPSKRKLDLVRDPTEIYKFAKHARVEDAPSPPAGPLAPTSDDDDDEGDYGPSAPPDNDDDEANDDPEGRFFGSGITATERVALDFMDAANLPDDAAAEEPLYTPAWLKRTSVALTKKIARNADLRARFADDPARFIDSEADLDAAVRGLSVLAEHAELYPEFVSLGCVESLLGLLAHENTDIALAAVEIVGELTDEDVNASEEEWWVLVDGLVEGGLVGLVVSNLARLDEKEETDREGVYRALGVVENLCSRGETAEKVGQEEGLVKWLLERVGREERPVGQNKQYAAEVLAIIVSGSRGNRKVLAGLDAVDAMLQLVAAYRKRDPEKGGDEEEYMENLFEALTSLVDEPEGKAKFVEAEGVELCLLMIKEGKLSKPAGLRLLDHATGGAAGTGVCEKIVEAGGLKTVFTTFIKKHDRQLTEHLVGIFASMLRLLPAESPERIRTLAKFVEKDYEKTDKLVKLRGEYAARMRAVDGRIAQEKRGMDAQEQEDMAGEWFSRRLDAGLFCLQTIDVILAWLVAEDDGAGKKIRALLGERGETVAVVRETIQEQIDGIDVESEESKEMREMLATLVRFLQ